LDRTRIIIADDESLIRMDLREMLTNLGYLVIDEAGDAARILTEEKIAPVLLLSAYSQQELVQRAQEAGVAGYLVKPFRESDLTPAIEVALARFSEFRTIERELDDVSDALETRKLVDRAKGILMESKDLNESEAFRRIQKMSMDNRKPMKTVAEAIILAHQAGA